jgi:hypothetical protein
MWVDAQRNQRLGTAMRALALVCLGITILIPEAGAQTRGNSPTPEPTTTIRTGSTNVNVSPAGSMPYAIIANGGDRSKRSFAVQLERRISEADLKRIAGDIRNTDLGIQDASTVVMFYLPGMKLGHGVWAHAYFPETGAQVSRTAQEPKITIVGLSMADEDRLVLAARTDSRNLVGAWLTAVPVGKVTLYREKGRMFAEWGLRDGSRFTEEVVEVALAEGGWRYDRRDGGTGEHLRMTPDGDLELRDRHDIITTAQTIKRQPGDFNLAIAKTNQVKGTDAKISEGKSPIDKNGAKKLAAGRGTIVITTVGSATTTATTTASANDKTSKPKTALPDDKVADPDSLANVIFR